MLTVCANGMRTRFRPASPLSLLLCLCVCLQSMSIRRWCTLRSACCGPCSEGDNTADSPPHRLFVPPTRICCVQPEHRDSGSDSQEGDRFGHRERCVRAGLRMLHAPSLAITSLPFSSCLLVLWTCSRGQGYEEPPPPGRARQGLRGACAFSCLFLAFGVLSLDAELRWRRFPHQPM